MISHERFDTAELDRALMSVLSVNPDSFILLRVGLSLGGDWDGNPGKMWLDKNPDDRWKAVNGSTGNEDTVSWASDKWFKDNNGYDALGILSKIIDYINSDPYYAARVVGYHPCVGEWFEPYCREKGADASVTNTKKFRAWLKDKYKTDAALKAAWADGTATLAGAAVPDVPGNGGRTETRSLLTEKSDTRTIDFYEYTQWLVASRIKEFNKLVKQKTNNRCLTVAFYGYEMEVVTPLSGHNAVEALLQDKNMDALVSPISYHDRNEGGLGGFMSPVDAVQSAGKLWIVEDDIRLLNNPDDPDASYNPAAGSVAAALEIHKREMGALLIRGAGTWFMDLWGSGWLDHPDIWKNIGNLYPLYTSYTGKMTVSSGDKTAFRPQVAVILDEDGSYRYAMPMKTGFDSLSRIGLGQEFVDTVTGLMSSIFDLLWKCGVQTLLFLSGLQSVPSSFYEAASVEGASSWEKFWKITFPSIAPILLIGIVYTIVDSFTYYGNNIMLRAISPALDNLRYSYAAAMSLTYSAMVMAVLGLVFLLVGRRIIYTER